MIKHPEVATNTPNWRQFKHLPRYPHDIAFVKRIYSNYFVHTTYRVTQTKQDNLMKIPLRTKTSKAY